MVHSSLRKIREGQLRGGGDVHDALYSVASSFITDIYEEGKCAHIFDINNAILKPNITLDEFITQVSLILGEGCSKIYENIYSFHNKSIMDLDTAKSVISNGTYVHLPSIGFVSKSSFAQITSYINTKDHINLDIALITSDREVITKLDKLVEDICNKQKQNDGSKRDIYMLRATRDNLTLSPIKSSKIPYIKENYSSLVQEKYQHMVEDLTAVVPCGRLSILSGVPGTGKTFLVRSLFTNAEDVSFILIKPDVIESLTDPSCIPALVEHQNSYERPMVFILEDADSCLTTRMTDNMARISALLNTSDGILGSTLDIRIIATTNAPKVDIDDAILRPGRLCTHIQTDRLEMEQSLKILKRLIDSDDKGVWGQNDFQELLSKSIIEQNYTGFGKRYNNPTWSLAEIYKAAYSYNKKVNS